MSPIASGLLRLLGGGAAAPPSANPVNPGQIAGANFATLLQQARTGGFASGRQITVGPGSGVNLSADQLQRIADAADKAEAQGATRALVLVDGMALRVDLTSRQVTGAADLNTPGVLSNIDAVVSVPSVDPKTGTQLLPLPSGNTALGNPSLLKTLAGAP